MSWSKHLPPPATLLELEPEEIAIDLLRGLHEQDGAEQRGDLHLYNTTLPSSIQNYSGATLQQPVARALTEAWIWLEREGLLAPAPGKTGDWRYVTRRGLRTLRLAEPRQYLTLAALPASALDAELRADIESAWLRGELDSVVRSAFRRVEIRVRSRSGSTIHSATDMMNNVFREGGALASPALSPAEQKATREIFAGAMGRYRNPHTHADVGINDIQEALELVMFANHLLRVVTESSGRTRLEDRAPA